MDGGKNNDQPQPNLLPIFHKFSRVRPSTRSPKGGSIPALPAGRPETLDNLLGRV
ncbi:MAG: hypothetical protein Q8N98_01570 [bacterium]|nr:hypothetical protein [bacterium]